MNLSTLPGPGDLPHPQDNDLDGDCDCGCNDWERAGRDDDGRTVAICDKCGERVYPRF